MFLTHESGICGKNGIMNCCLWPRNSSDQQLGGFGSVFFVSCGDDKTSTCGSVEQRGETRGKWFFDWDTRILGCPPLYFKGQDLLQPGAKLERHLTPSCICVPFGGEGFLQVNSRRWLPTLLRRRDGVAHQSKVWDHIFHHHDRGFSALFFAEMIASGCH